MGKIVDNNIKLEFIRLERLGWEIPKLKSFGLIKPSPIDEGIISFPSQIWEGSRLEQGTNEFWETQRVNSIADILKKLKIETIWEIGAGNGSVAVPLRDRGFNVIPVEPLKSGAILLLERGFTTFWSTLESLKLPDNSIQAIGAFDVLEHLAEPGIFLDEVHRILKPGGVFICSVPAYQWLFSDFDLALGHYRRYSKRSLRQVLLRSNLPSISLNYLFAFLIIPAFVLRRIPYVLGRNINLSKTMVLNRYQSYLMTKMQVLLRIVLLMEKKLRLKFGLSIISTSFKN